ncbi:MAG: cytochrome c oxidase subunit 3 [Planctomycetota bacterium]
MAELPPTPDPPPRTPRDKEHPAPGSAPLLMAFFLAALAVLFLSAVVGYFLIRADRGERWLPVDYTGLPWTLWLSSAALVVSSVTVQLALQAARAGDGAGLRRMLAATSALGAAFLLLQALNWWELASLFQEIARPYRELTGPELLQLTQTRTHPAGYSFLAFFYFFTALHALHLIGGLIPLGVTTRRAFAGRYTREEHGGVWLCAAYWHFLDAVWLTLFGILLIG